MMDTAKLGSTTLYAALDASFSQLCVNRGKNEAHGNYQRGDFHPVLSLPIKNIPWLSLTGRGGGRLTYYSDSVTPLTTSGQEFSGERLTRRYWEGGISMVGPSVSKIYDFSFGPFVKWKHIIEPRVDYNWVSDVNGLAQVPLFDEVDSVFGQSAVTYKLVNRLLAKGAENVTAAGGAEKPATDSSVGTPVGDKAGGEKPGTGKAATGGTEKPGADTAVSA